MHNISALLRVSCDGERFRRQVWENSSSHFAVIEQKDSVETENEDMEVPLENEMKNEKN